MALTVPQSNHISNVARISRELLELYGALIRLDVQWAGTGNYKTTIVQADLDAVALFKDAGLTTATNGTVGTLPDAEFALASIKTSITNAIAALDAAARAG